MKFKTRMINAAVAAALGTVAGAAQAVNLGNDGEGQVLLYPYYTTQSKPLPAGGTGAYNTLLTIVNSDSVYGKAVKVRFLEGKNSLEVLDFNLYLSPNDMWTASLLNCPAIGGANQCLAVGAPMMQTTDNSCTAQEIPIVSGSGSGAVRQIAFKNYAYLGDPWKDNSLGRAMEGYVEVIEMGSYSSGLTYNWSLHSQSTQIPANCAAIRNSWLDTNGDSIADIYTAGSLAAPTGHLSGAVTYINVPEGTDGSVDAVALENFSDVANHQAPGSIRPDLTESSLGGILRSNVFDGTKLVSTNWGPAAPQATTTGGKTTAIPVSAVFIRNQGIMEYVALASPVGFQTDHVITMPTKRFHQRVASLGGTALPFTTTATQNFSGTCEPVSITFYNRDETIQSLQPGFSPPPPSQTNQLCTEVSVIPINGLSGAVQSNVLGSVNLKVSNVNPAFGEGWVRYGFGQTVTAPNGLTCFASLIGDPANQFTCNNPGGVTYTGLPFLGFFIEDFVNLSNLASFGTAYAARYTRSINPAPRFPINGVGEAF